MNIGQHRKLKVSLANSARKPQHLRDADDEVSTKVQDGKSAFFTGGHLLHRKQPITPQDILRK